MLRSALTTKGKTGGRSTVNLSTKVARLRVCAGIGSQHQTGHAQRLGTWLAVTPGVRGKVGCKVCAWAADALASRMTEGDTLHIKASSWTEMDMPLQSLRLNQVKSHGDSIGHKLACKAYVEAKTLGSGRGDILRGIVSAPPASEFEAVANAVQTGSSGDPLVNHMSSRRKTSIQWCISEAVRDSTRKFLRSAKCISISLDESNGRLLIKFRGVSGDGELIVREGCLAIFRDPGD